MWLVGGVMDINFGRADATKLGRAENVQNLAQFLTTFEFDRKYLRNGSTRRKSENSVINCNPSPIGWKKCSELWSTNKKVIDINVNPTYSGLFQEITFRTLGVLAHQFFNTPYDSNCISSPTRDAGWPQFAIGSFSKLRRPIAVKLCHVITICINFIMQVQKFGGGGLSPKNCGPKTC